MYLESIVLKNFRNHSYLNLDFSNKVNAFTGDNGSGKTNIAEAIHYLSLARSFRTNDASELIQAGKDEASIDAVIRQGAIKRKVRILISKEGRAVMVNGKPVTRLSDLSGVVNVILFEPGDVMLFRGSPRERRNFLDVSISKESLPYLKYISDYGKVLRERNELLKGQKVDIDLLRAQTDMLVKLSGPIITYRQNYIRQINGVLGKIVRALTGATTDIEITYQPFVPFDSKFQDSARNAFRRAEEGDIRRKVTSIGPHRDDFLASLNGRNVADYGSQGENRIAALSLKLTPFFLIEDRDKRPIVVLDDVLSELDKGNRDRLIAFMDKFEQVFITATKLDKKGITEFPIRKKGELQ